MVELLARVAGSLRSGGAVALATGLMAAGLGMPAWGQEPASVDAAPPSVAPQAIAEDAPDSAPQGSVWTVSEGDSWFSMRSRMCPVADLQEANPALAQRSLQIGDKVRAPFVSVALLERVEARMLEAEKRAAAARAEADQRIAQANGRVAEVSDRLAALEGVDARLQALRASSSRAQLVQLGLGLAVVALLLGVAAVGSVLVASRRSATLRERRMADLESQYTELRRGLSDLEVQLQRRMLKLLSWHETRVLTEREVEEATAPVLEMARKLKTRHAS